MLLYRENNYFNDEDYFLFKNNLNQLLISKCEMFNGNWYSQNYKLTSVPCINFKDLYNKEITLKNGIKGKIIKALKNNIGILYNQGQNFKELGLPSYWQELYYNIKLSNIN